MAKIDETCGIGKELYQKGYKQGKAEGYSQAEKDYFAQSQKDREDTYNCGYAIGRQDAIDEFNDKVNYIKKCYVDACNMCTKMECDVCAVNNFIEDLEQLKE